MDCKSRKKHCENTSHMGYKFQETEMCEIRLSNWHSFRNKTSAEKTIFKIILKFRIYRQSVHRISSQLRVNVINVTATVRALLYRLGKRYAFVEIRSITYISITFELLKSACVLHQIPQNHKVKILTKVVVIQ